jgi:hypothetical protein
LSAEDPCLSLAWMSSSSGWSTVASPGSGPMTSPPGECGTCDHLWCKGRMLGHAREAHVPR